MNKILDNRGGRNVLNLKHTKKRTGNQQRVFTIRPRERQQIEEESEVLGVMRAGRKAPGLTVGEGTRVLLQSL